MKKIVLAMLALGLLVGSATATEKTSPKGVKERPKEVQKTQKKTEKGLVPPEGQPAKGSQKTQEKTQKVPPVKN
jgi:hypothetical protein